MFNANENRIFYVVDSCCAPMQRMEVSFLILDNSSTNKSTPFKKKLKSFLLLEDWSTTVDASISNIEHQVDDFTHEKQNEGPGSCSQTQHNPVSVKADSPSIPLARL